MVLLRWIMNDVAHENVILVVSFLLLNKERPFLHVSLRIRCVCSTRQGRGRHPQACAWIASPPQAERAWYRCWTGSIMRFRYARAKVSLGPWSAGRVRGRTNGSLPPPPQAGWPPHGPRPHQEGQSMFVCGTNMAAVFASRCTPFSLQCWVVLYVAVSRSQDVYQRQTLPLVEHDTPWRPVSAHVTQRRCQNSRMNVGEKYACLLRK